MADLDLLKAGFSEIFSGDECSDSIHNLVSKTYGIIGPPLPFDEICVFVNGWDGKTIQASKWNTIAQFKAVLQKKSGIPMTKTRLIFGSKQLDAESKDTCTLSDYGICDGSTIHMVFRQLGGGSQPAPSELKFNTAELDSTYDYDFSNVKDDGKIYMRGGYVYQRPYGWNRTAIKVVDKYENNAWLGPNGLRVEEAQSEWPVSYHGTDISRANSILKTGLKPGPRAMYGRGIYSSPSLEMVESFYAQQFTHKGKTYKIAFQNRVNPASLTVIPDSQTGVGADYWLSASPGDVRPYGLVIREVKS